jgi:hypothetical protein
MDPAWTWTNQAGAAAVRVDPQGLLLTAPVEGFGTINQRILTKPLSGPFDVWTRLDLYGHHTRYNQVGLCAMDAGRMILMGLVGNDTGLLVDVWRYNSPTTAVQRLGNQWSQFSPSRYARMKFDGATLRCYWSYDGRYWWEVAAESVGAGQHLTGITGVGIAWQSSNTVYGVQAYVPYIRRFS